MKNITIKAGFLLGLFLLSGVSLFAQEGHKEESKMLVKVMKDGKALLDTTYLMDKDFDQKKIEAMIEDMDGDEKTIKIFKTGGEHSHSVDYFISSETDSVMKGDLKWVTKEGNKMIISENIVMEEISEGEDGRITKHIVLRSGDDAGKSEAQYVVVKNIGEKFEGDELETEIEIW